MLKRILLLIIPITASTVLAAGQKTGSVATLEGLMKRIRSMPATRHVEKWPNEYSDGLLIETRHYKVYTTLLEPLMLKKIPAFVEAAWKQYQSQVPVPIESKYKFIVYLFKDRQQWEEFRKEREKIRREAIERAMAILTDEQNAKLSDLTGEPFEFG